MAKDLLAGHSWSGGCTWFAPSVFAPPKRGDIAGANGINKRPLQREDSTINTYMVHIHYFADALIKKIHAECTIWLITVPGQSTRHASTDPIHLDTSEFWLTWNQFRVLMIQP